MRKYIALVLALVCVLALFDCSKAGEEKEVPTTDNIESATTIETESSTELEIVEPHISIPDFSYAEESAIYAEGEPGVKTSGFTNTSETEITFENVAEHAKNECTIEYDSVTTYLDTAECVWKVHFYTYGTLGGDQTVYLDYDGKTVLIVYGE